MLNLFDKKTRNTSFVANESKKINFFTGTAQEISNENREKNNNLGETRHYPPATKEWFNSIYSYNKNYIKTLPIVDNIVNKLIKSYFNLRPLHKNKKSSRVQIRFKRLSLNRILVSRAEMKHTNNKVIITVYLYNKNKKFFLYKLKNLYKRFLFRIRKVVSVKGQSSTRYTGKSTMLNKNIVNAKARNNSKIFLTSKKLSKFSSLRFKNAKKTLHQHLTVKTNYSFNFTNLTKNKLKNFLVNGSARNNSNALKEKYFSLLKKYYFLQGNKKVNTLANNNYFLNYVNLGKSNSSIKINQNIYTDKNSEKTLKKNTFFSTRLWNGLTPGLGQGNTRKNNNYFMLSQENNVKNYFKYGKKNLLARKKISSIKGRNIRNFIYKLRNLHKLFFINKMQNLDKTLMFEKDFISRKFLLRNLHNVLKNKNTIIRKINTISLRALKILKKARKKTNFFKKALNLSNQNLKNYETKYYKNFIKKSYRKEILYLYYIKLLKLNNNKFKNWFILGLKKIISKIYHKKVEFNLVNLKYLHLNSDIFSESIAIKLRNRENRLLRVLKKALTLVKLPYLNKSSLIDKKMHNFFINKYETINVKRYVSMLKDKDLLHEVLYKIFPSWGVLDTNKIDSSVYSQRKNNLKENILNSSKHKNIYGVRLEAQGRLSRRLTASRSVFKLKYKGSLKNVDSSYKNISSVMLRGNTKSNIMLTKISSKTRNGAFGLKGWISSN